MEPDDKKGLIEMPEFNTEMPDVVTEETTETASEPATTAPELEVSAPEATVISPTETAREVATPETEPETEAETPAEPSEEVTPPETDTQAEDSSDAASDTPAEDEVDTPAETSSDTPATDEVDTPVAEAPSDAPVEDEVADSPETSEVPTSATEATTPPETVPEATSPEIEVSISHSEEASVPETDPTPETVPEAATPETEAPIETTPDVPEAADVPPEIFDTAVAQPGPAFSSAPLFPVDTPAAGVPAAAGGGLGRKRNWLLPAIGAAIGIALLTGGYVLAFYLPNTPSAVFDTSLNNSGVAVDKLLQYGTLQAATKTTSAEFAGKLTYKSGTVSGDATVSGAFDKDTNGTLKVDANVAGQKVSAEIRSVHASGNESPDVYLQLTGVKATLDGFGLSSLSGSVEGKWIAIDHTLVDTYASSLKTTANADSGSTIASASNIPTEAQILDGANKLQAVNKQYLFTTDKDKAVLTYQSFVAKETQDGRRVNHYKASYDKTHLQAYVAAVKTALDASQLNDWSKKANGGKSVSEVLNFSALTDSAKNAKAGYTFDLWADSKDKLVHSIRFTDPANANSSFTIAQNYTGGDSYPFTFSTADKTSTTTSSTAMTLTLNTKTNKVGVTLKGANTDSTSGTTAYNADFSATPSNKAVAVTAPTSSTPFMTLLGQLGLGGGIPADISTLSEGSGSSGAVSDLFTLTQ